MTAQWGGTKNTWGSTNGVTNVDFNRLEENVQYLKNSCMIYSSAGTYKFVVPLDITMLLVTVIGAGGAGGGCDTTQNYSGGGGGGGAVTLRAPVPVTPGQEISITVGAGGAANTYTSGGNGGASNFGGIIIAAGGYGGGVGTASPSASGGSPGRNELWYDLSGRSGSAGTTNGSGGNGGGNIYFSDNGDHNKVLPGVGGTGGDYANGNIMPGRGGDGLVVVEY